MITIPIRAGLVASVNDQGFGVLRDEAHWGDEIVLGDAHQILQVIGALHRLRDAMPAETMTDQDREALRQFCDENEL